MEEFQRRSAWLYTVMGWKCTPDHIGNLILHNCPEIARDSHFFKSICPVVQERGACVHQFHSGITVLYIIVVWLRFWYGFSLCLSVWLVERFFMNILAWICLYPSIKLFNFGRYRSEYWFKNLWGIVEFDSNLCSSLSSCLVNNTLKH